LKWEGKSTEFPIAFAVLELTSSAIARIAIGSGVSPHLRIIFQRQGNWEGGMVLGGLKHYSLSEGLFFLSKPLRQPLARHFSFL